MSFDYCLPADCRTTMSCRGTMRCCPNRNACRQVVAKLGWTSPTRESATESDFDCEEHFSFADDGFDDLAERERRSMAELWTMCQPSLVNQTDFSFYDDSVAVRMELRWLEHRHTRRLQYCHWSLLQATDESDSVSAS